MGTHWIDEASSRAEEQLKARDIVLPWHYGDQFGERFKVIGLRAGGIGVVFFVESTQFREERLYAAKTLQRFLHQDYWEKPSYEKKKIADAFLGEALPWLEMGQHTNIVAVHLLDNIIHPLTGRNVPFVFSEYMEGGDLSHYVKEKGSLSLEKTLEMTLGVGLQICEGLLHAYKYGLSVHKDLKPDNIMVYRNGIYKVTDFSAGVAGTPGYMAPEQVAVYFQIEDKTIDQRADQFAIGLIIHDVFKGGDVETEVGKRYDYIRSDPMRFIKEGLEWVFSDDIPGSLQEIINKCLYPEAKDRFNDISKLREALLKAYRKEFKKAYDFPQLRKDDSPQWWLNRGNSFYNIGRYASAEIPFKKGLIRLESIPGTEIDQADCLVNLGNVYNYTNRFQEAEIHIEAALKKFISSPETEKKQAAYFINIGNTYNETGRYQEAEIHYKAALEKLEYISGTEMDRALCLVNLGSIYRNTGRFQEAGTHLTAALKEYESIPGTEIHQARCLMTMGNTYRNSKQFQKAETSLKEAFEIFKIIPGTEIEQAMCLMNLGAAYSDTGQFQKAESCLKEASKRFESIPGRDIDQAMCLTNLGNLYMNTGRFLEAEEHLKTALKRFESIPGRDIDRAMCLNNLALYYRKLGQIDKAQNCALNALKLCKKFPPKVRDHIRSFCMRILDK